MAFNKQQFRAAAQWWADQLPGRGPIFEQEADSVGTIRQDGAAAAQSIREGFSLPGLAAAPAVTDQQYQIFMGELARMLETSVPQKTLDEKAYLELATDYGPVSGALSAACMFARINGTDLPFKTSMYLQDDGQIIIPQGGRSYAPLAYEGQPEIPYMSIRSETYTANPEFESCPYFMKEERFLAIRLTPGQEFKSVSGGKYYTRIAKNDEFLVVPKSSAASVFNSLTQNDLLDLENHPSIKWTYQWSADEVADGAKRTFGEGTVEKLDDEGHLRTLSLPFRAKEITATVATGRGGHYQILNPGDFLTETVRKNYTSIEIVTKSELESGEFSWVSSANDGKLVAVVAPPPFPR